MEALQGPYLATGLRFEDLWTRQTGASKQVEIRLNEGLASQREGLTDTPKEKMPGLEEGSRSGNLMSINDVQLALMGHLTSQARRVLGFVLLDGIDIWSSLPITGDRSLKRQKCLPQSSYV